MSEDFFTQLEAELGGLAREGVHLADPAARARRRLMTMLRRGVAILTLAIALAASFDSEFPATARGYASSAAATVTHDA